ncbi:MAG: hypothetical protein AAF810_24735 [Cyanobacteria bacterium P01_D01_bin.36]
MVIDKTVSLCVAVASKGYEVEVAGVSRERSGKVGGLGQGRSVV